MGGRNPSGFLHGRRRRWYDVCCGGTRSTWCPVSLGIPAARLATWREAFLAAGQEALPKQPLDSRARELGHLREKLGASTMAIEVLRENMERFETDRPLPRRRARRCARPSRPPWGSPMAWRGSGACGVWPAPRSTGSGIRPLRLAPDEGPVVPGQMTSWSTSSGVSWKRHRSPAKGTVRGGHGCGMAVSARRHAGWCA
jgi:hypothetical protein